MVQHRRQADRETLFLIQMHLFRQFGTNMGISWMIKHLDSRGNGFIMKTLNSVLHRSAGSILAKLKQLANLVTHMQEKR